MINTSKLLTEHHLIDETDVIRAGLLLFNKDFAPGDPIPVPPFRASKLNPGRSSSDRERFYKQVNNNVGVRVIENVLTIAGFEDLMELRDKFAYIDEDGEEYFHAMTMIFLIYNQVDPTTEVGMDLVLKMLENCKLAEHGNDVHEMLKFMEKCCRKLRNNGKAPPNFRRLLLDALASGQNHVFNTYIARITDDVEAGYGEFSKITPGQLISAARSKYNNMQHKKIWDKKAPPSAEMLALVTRISELENAAKSNALALATAGSGNGSGTTNSSADDAFITGTKVKKWRIVYTKDKVKRDGKDWWWCKHHVNVDPTWNGMYVSHKPDRCPKNSDRKKGDSSANKSGTSDSGGDAKLTLKNNLKAALASELCMADEDINKLLERAESGN